MWNLTGDMNNHKKKNSFLTTTEWIRTVANVDVIYVQYIVNNGAMRSLRCNWASFLMCEKAIPTSSSVCGTEQAVRPRLKFICHILFGVLQLAYLCIRWHAHDL